ncbi:6651_t:CDS:2, partial [Racocetra fulgida]
ELTPDELPHYAKKTQDLYFDYHFEDLSIDGIIPEVVEVSFGVERLMLAILEDAYHEEIVDSGLKKTKRTFLKLHPLLAPYFAAIIPLSPRLKEFAYQLYLNLLPRVQFNLTYEQASSIGKSYRRQDAIGTYYCLTVDFQSRQGQDITLRHRNTPHEQIRINITSLAEHLNQEYLNCQQEFFQ